MNVSHSLKYNRVVQHNKYVDILAMHCLTHKATTTSALVLVPTREYTVFLLTSNNL